MQVKPRFSSFKIIEQHYVLTDDTGNDMNLTLLEVKLPSNEMEITETSYSFWCVIGKKQEQYSNGAIAYSSVAFWKAKKKDTLFKGIVNGILVEEVEDGGHFVFDDRGGPLRKDGEPKVGLRTTFKIKR